MPQIRTALFACCTKRTCRNLILCTTLKIGIKVLFHWLSLLPGCEGGGTHNTHEDTSLVKPGQKFNRGRCFVHRAGLMSGLVSWQCGNGNAMAMCLCVNCLWNIHYVSNLWIFSSCLFQMIVYLTLDVPLLWDCLSPRGRVHLSRWRPCGYSESQVRTILYLHC